MAEDQGVNGDEWNKSAVKLLSLLGWEHIGDFDMDVKGVDEKYYGVDSIMKYESPSLATKQSVIIESKRYSVNSFNEATFNNWLKRLNTKLDAFQNSSELLEQFPTLSDCCTFNLGVIIIWFHDLSTEEFIKGKFRQILQSPKMYSMPRNHGYKRIIVLDNSKILKLCYIYDIVKSGEIRFLYPSQLIGNKPVRRSSILTIDYILSNIILAEKKANNGSSNIVFYFGQFTVAAFKLLYAALLQYQFLDADKDLTIYHYDNSDQNRKIKPEIQNIFKGVSLSLLKMNHYQLNNVPPILENDEES